MRSCRPGRRQPFALVAVGVAADLRALGVEDDDVPGAHGEGVPALAARPGPVAEVVPVGVGFVAVVLVVAGHGVGLVEEPTPARVVAFQRLGRHLLVCGVAQHEHRVGGQRLHQVGCGLLLALHVGDLDVRPASDVTGRDEGHAARPCRRAARGSVGGRGVGEARRGAGGQDRHQENRHSHGEKSWPCREACAPSSSPGVVCATRERNSIFVGGLRSWWPIPPLRHRTALPIATCPAGGMRMPPSSCGSVRLTVIRAAGRGRLWVRTQGR